MRYELDARRLLCPMPVIKAQNKVRELQPGDELIVWCTDPGALEDVPCWCRMYGHEVLQTETVDNEIKIHLTVGANNT